MKNYLLSFFVFSLCFSGCTKSQAPKGKDILVNSDLKEAFNFKTGTYWVYKDSISGEMDTFHVVYHLQKLHDAPPTNRTEATLSVVEFRSTNGRTKESWHYQMYSENKFSLTHFDQKGLNAPMRHYSYAALDYPFQVSDRVSILPSYNVADSTYTNVLLLRDSKPGQYEEELYLAPGIGLVKMRMLHFADTATGRDSSFQVLELQGYKIVK